MMTITKILNLPEIQALRDIPQGIFHKEGSVYNHIVLCLAEVNGVIRC